MLKMRPNNCFANGRVTGDVSRIAANEILPRCSIIKPASADAKRTERETTM